MEIIPFQPYPWNLIYNTRFSLLYHLNYLQQSPQNHVHWTETPESHIFSADIPGLRKEEIKVEVEDSIYMIIRTEESQVIDPESNAEFSRSFMRKFRLPSRVDVEGISAGYENGVLTVTVPRRGFIFIDRLDIMSNRNSELTARAA